MSKEAEILRKYISSHVKHMCQKSRKSRGSCTSGVLQKVTLKDFSKAVGVLRISKLFKILELSRFFSEPYCHMTNLF